MAVSFREALDGPVVLTVPCFRYLNLLAHAQLEEATIGSQCGGHGICGADQLRITLGLEHTSPVTEIERSHLGETRIRQGWRLGCQCYPQSDDAEIEIVAPALSLRQPDCI